MSYDEAFATFEPLKIKSGNDQAVEHNFVDQKPIPVAYASTDDDI